MHSAMHMRTFYHRSCLRRSLFAVIGRGATKPFVKMNGLRWASYRSE